MSIRARENTKSGVLAALGGAFGQFLIYYSTEMDMQISQIVQSEHVDAIFKWCATSGFFTGIIGARYRDKLSPVQAPLEPVPRPVDTPLPPPLPKPVTKPAFVGVPKPQFDDSLDFDITQVVDIVHDKARFGNYDAWQCPCDNSDCSKNRAMPDELYSVLIDASDHFGGAKIYVNSGVRCAAYNATTPNASRKSQHILERACDFTLVGTQVSHVRSYLLQKYPDKYGIGTYDTFIHIDIRPKRARW